MNQHYAERINTQAECLWDYLRLEQEPLPADCIIVMGSHDLGTVPRAVELWRQGLSDLLVFSGGYGKITGQKWRKPEADIFAQIALNLGVPKKNMLLETESSNCGENLIFSMQLLTQQNIKPKQIILVCKPYLERRAFATFKQHCPDVGVAVTSQRLCFTEYIASVADVEQVIHLMVGDLQRIMLYPAKGFQISQVIPSKVLQAFKQLVELGYDHYLINHNDVNDKQATQATKAERNY
ncbi:YdcF family protein [Paraglaciecola sp.]|uniref:YdcF family protein n=1 Tax=Paraglaciecola sp. TaxID=1920173 RepID=UPI0030F43902